MKHRGQLPAILAIFIGLALGSAHGQITAQTDAHDLAAAATAPPGPVPNPMPDKEFVVITGGVSLYEWEKFKAQPHDHWWANFVHASRNRFDQMRQQYGWGVRITWLVYRPAYQRRSQQEGRDVLALINSVRDAERLNLVWFDNTSDLVDYLNFGQDRSRVKIADLEYFGHSNKACWMFDYSNQIDSASKCWLHDSELGQIRRGDFAHGAFVKSWGCHTGEEMSSYWRTATGTRMYGAIGRTDYSNDYEVVLSTPGGKWVY